MFLKFLLPFPKHWEGKSTANSIFVFFEDQFRAFPCCLVQFMNVLSFLLNIFPEILWETHQMLSSNSLCMSYLVPVYVVFDHSSSQWSLTTATALNY